MYATRPSRSAALFDSKVLLVGDALFLFRPNIAFSTYQAAFDCLELEKCLKGEIGMEPLKLGVVSDN